MTSPTLTNATPAALAQQCRTLFTEAGAAIDWVADVRRTSPTLDRNSDSLIETLRRERMLARRLGAAASRPMSIGFFGLSQAGKSYLISALAVNSSGELDTEMDGRRLNFISHINPPGDGKEATGLVTRFTRQGRPTPAGSPVLLTLFSEADLIKILGNSFFNDFDRETVAFRHDAHFLREHLTALKSRVRPQPTGGMTPEDVIDIMDYFSKRFTNTVKPFMADFFPTAVDLAPYLSPADRAVLFSVLWGEIPDLTATYLTLRNALDMLGHARFIAAPLSALVSEKDGVLSQSDSIMNVDILQRLGRDGDDPLSVIPAVDESGWGTAVPVARSTLAALTAELQFMLVDQPQAKLLEQVDLLDFPGYRGRLKVTDLGDVRKKLEGRDPVAELVLRGKVAYLFERYTDDQEMNVVVVCAPCDKQSDVEELGDALKSWIDATQGQTPDERARRKSGLIWAITKMDIRLRPKPGETVDLMRGAWPGMMRLTLLERFEKYDWVHNWSSGKPFDTTFLVRKRGMATDVIDTTGISEKAIRPEQAERLGTLRQTFLAEPLVQKHIHAADTAWDSMLALNDGGMGRLTAYLEQVAVPAVKTERIAELVTALQQRIVDKQLGPYFRSEGVDEVNRKEALAKRVVDAVKEQRDYFGELLHTLQPDPEFLRGLYLRSESEMVAEDATPVENNLISLDNFGLDADENPATPVASPAASRATNFARAVMRDWFKRLDQLPSNPAVQRELKLSAATLHDLVGEIKTAALRLRIESRLEAALNEAERMDAATRDRLVGRQVLVVLTQLGGFIDDLGFGWMPLAERPASIAARDRRIFAPPPAIAVGTLPVLATKQAVNYAGIYIVDWCEAFRAAAIGNAGHSEDRDITPEQNRRLGAIIAAINSD